MLQRNPEFVLNRQHWAPGLSRDKTTFFTTKKVPEDSVWDFPGTKNVFYYKKSPGGVWLLRTLVGMHINL